MRRSKPISNQRAGAMLVMLVLVAGCARRSSTTHQRSPSARFRHHRPALWKCAALSLDGKTLASAGLAKKVKYWDVNSANERVTLGVAVDPRAVAFTPSGRNVIVGAINGNVSVWSAADGRPLATLPGHTKLLFKAAFAPDGKTMATASGDGTIRLWELPKALR